MLKVILVDDEPNVRQGVKMMIPWDELDLEVIAEGEDGDDGLNKILIHNPDIVIADVKMPGMTGIEMLSAAQKSGFKGHALILSGYSDFTYAKEAISLGVKQFILKPVDEDELIECLKQTRDSILEEQASHITIRKGNEYINEQFIKSLLLGENVGIASREYDDYCIYNTFTVALVSAVSDAQGEGRNVMLEMTKKQLMSYEDIDVITVDINGMIGVIFKGWEPSMIKSVTDLIVKNYHGRIFITVGCDVFSPDKISASYLSAMELYNNRFLYLHCGAVFYGKIHSTPEEPAAPSDKFSKQIFTFMEINDIPRLESSFDEFQDSLCKSMYTPEKIKVICITTVLNIKALIVKSVGDKKADQFADEMIISHIGSMNSLFEIIELMKKEFTAVSNAIYGRTTKSTMERVVQYIQSNYNQELRLEMLANIFGYNSAYLGKVFHQYMGDNFNNYLDRIRITEAKRLLAMNEYKVYEVAEMVGYTNINYFHNKFKKYVGVSPLNYKKTCLGEAASDDDGEE